MTREQMLDEAVRRSIKRPTMEQILENARFEMRVREDCQPFPRAIQALADAGRWDDVKLFQKAHPKAEYTARSWWDGDLGSHGFDRFPRRLQAIRKEFHRMAVEQAD